MIVNSNISQNQYCYNNKQYMHKPLSFQANINEPESAKLTKKDAAKYFLKGVASPVTNIFKSTKNFVMGLSCMAGITMAVALTNGALVPPLVLAGLGMAAYDMLNGIDGLFNAKNLNDKKKAFYNLGSGTGGIAFSLGGAKIAFNKLRSTNIKSTVIKAHSDLVNSSKQVFNRNNLLAFIKNPFLTQADNLIVPDVVKTRFSNEVVHYGEVGQNSFNAADKMNNKDKNDKKQQKMNKVFAPFLANQ